jgi:hypothetical protein
MALVFWRRDPLLTRAEMNGLIVLLMRLEANVARMAGADGGESGEQKK